MELDYRRIDPELLPFLEGNPSIEINRDNILRVRQILDARPRPPIAAEVAESRVTIPTDDVDVPALVYRKSDRAGQPAVLWIHGGGYLVGKADDVRARIIADRCDVTVFSVEYRLAPEHPFPAGPEDCYAALEWLMSGRSGYDIDVSRVAVGGASAGGGMAAGVALMNRDRANYPLRLQLLLYPMIDNLHATDSGAYVNHPVWNRATSLNAWEMYLDGEPGHTASPYAAASRAANLAGLPPAYVCVGTEDLFRDEDIEYARRLIDADVPAEIAVFPGLYHGADLFVPDAAISRRLARSFLQSLDDALNGGKSP